jgi:hypothetical protein
MTDRRSFSAPKGFGSPVGGWLQILVDIHLSTSEDALVHLSPPGREETGAAMNVNPKSGISVSGTGEITGTPDTVTINLGVSVRRNTVQQATSDAADAAANLIDSLTSNGIDPDSITTTRYSINPEYDHRHDAQILLGYRVDNTVRARISDIAESGNVIDQATTASGDAIRVDGISFSIEDDASLVSAAREAAWNDARTKAEQLAGLAGRKLGPVISISETVGRPPAPMQMARLQAADSATPLQPGSSAVSVSLQVDFSLQG